LSGPITVTITVSEADAEVVRAMCAELGQTPQRLIERLVHRSVNQRSQRPPRSNQARSADRATRQLAMIRWVQEHGMPEGKRATAAFAELFEVNERTAYRDLQVVGLTLLKQPPPPAAEEQPSAEEEPVLAEA
jgi:hypothetical protein